MRMTQRAARALALLLCAAVLLAATALAADDSDMLNGSQSDVIVGSNDIDKTNGVDRPDDTDQSGEAEGRTGTVKVNAGGQDYFDDLQEANVVLDIYRVAEALLSGRDLVGFEPVAPYENLSVGELTQESFQALAQTAAEMALELDEPFIEGVPAFERLKEGLAPGLYLVLARGADIEDYVTHVLNEDGESLLATRAHSEYYEYTYLPELISVPYRASDDDVWSYDAIVTLKPERGLRAGVLSITKTLKNYRPDGPAIFIFSVKAVLDGETVYDNVVTVAFTEAGQRTLMLNIPVGATVTVREIYDGAGYEIVGSDTKTVTVTEEGATVEFVNDTDGTVDIGGGLVNEFYYDPLEGWVWTRIDPER